jgi:Tfp pilus assembly protein PilF
MSFVSASSPVLHIPVRNVGLIALFGRRRYPGLAVILSLMTAHMASADTPPLGTDELKARVLDCMHATDPAGRRDACTQVLAAPGITARQSAMAHFLRAAAWLQLQDDSKAMTDLNAAIEAAPDLTQALTLRAELRGKKRDYLAAAADYGVLLGRNPSSADLHDIRGVMLDNAGDHDAALAEFSTAISLAGKPAVKAHYLIDRGAAYQFERKWDLANADYAAALAIDPQFAEAHMGRGRIAYLHDDFDAAIPDFAVAMKRDAGREQLYEAIWLYLAALRKGPEVASATLPQIQSLDATFWPGPVLKVLRGEMKPEEVTLPKDDAIFGDAGARCEFDFYMAQLALAQGDKAKAIDLLKQAVATDIKEYVEHTAALTQLMQLQP